MDIRQAESDSDVEEEDLLVYADFDAVLEDGMFQPNSLLKIIALDSDEPFLQIGSQMYSGKWADIVGTQLFFEPEPAPPPSDPVFSDIPNTTLNYKFKTRKCLELSRIFINQKHTEALDDTKNENENSKDTTMDIEDDKSLENLPETNVEEEMPEKVLSSS